MPDIISARLSDEALARWRAWPTGQRSAMLCTLLVEQDIIHQKAQALDARVHHLLSIMAECRRLLAKTPPSEAVGPITLSRIIEQIDDQTEGTLHHAFRDIPDSDREEVDQ